MLVIYIDMKSENRLSKILEKRILQNEDPKLVSQIDKFLNNLEVVFVKWAKAHPNWKESEE
jgi:ribonuclease HI